MNARLRLAILNARAENLPKDNIERAIKKAAGADTDNYDEVRYEGYGPGGVAVIVEALTDNRNRTASAVRSYFTKSGGALGETGSVAFMFDRVGQITYPPPPAPPTGSGGCDRGRRRRRPVGRREPRRLHRFRIHERSGQGPRSGARPGGQREELLAAKTGTALDEEKAQSLMKLIDTLEDDDDVQNVYSNFEVSDEVLAKLTAA